MKLIFILISLVFPILTYSMVPIEAFTFDFNIKTVEMDRVKEEKLFKSVEALRKIFSSEEFRNRVINHRFLGKRRYHYNRGLSNRAIYKLILNGVETLYPVKNNSMDVEVELYSDYDSNVLGFTRPLSRRIWMNTKYFNRHDIAGVASHLTHEWLHKLGFEHEKERTELRKYSVPYAVGYIVKDLVKTLK